MKHVFLVAPAAAGIDLANAAGSVLEIVKKEAASVASFAASEKVPAALRSVEADAAMEELVGIN